MKQLDEYQRRCAKGTSSVLILRGNLGKYRDEYEIIFYIKIP